MADQYPMTWPGCGAGFVRDDSVEDAAPAAAQLDANALPPLPEPEEVDNVRWAYTADSMHNYAIDAIAPYAERIRLLTEELENWKKSNGLLAASRDRWKADAKRYENHGNSIDGPEFRKMLEDLCIAVANADGSRISRHMESFIAYIDGRTAGTAPDPAKHIEHDAVSTMLWIYRRLPRCYGRPPNVENPIRHLARLAGFDMKFVEDSFSERAAAPSLSGTEEGKS